MDKYLDKTLPCEDRAKDLLKRMDLEEKIFQLSSQIIFDVFGNEYKKDRDFRLGSIRNPGHFMHQNGITSSPKEVAKFMNDDVRKSIEANRFGIPALENGEALHGAQWGMATCFPQPIALASTFNPELVYEVASIIGMETAAAGVRQVFSPVINVVRDCRWGRTMETFGEDVTLVSDMGEAMCKGLQDNGVITTPKHFVDNYADGGRDSNESHSSWRTLLEVYLPPFERAIREGGAKSIMASYNSVDGLPCSCSERLLNGILREEWGFDGFVVSDYGGVEGVCYSHQLAEDMPRSIAKCLKAGLDAPLPYRMDENIKQAIERGYLDEKDVDKAAFRILKAKFECGLFDKPFVDEEKISEIVRSDEHKEMALRSARESIVLLKNDGLLPLKTGDIKTIGVFGLGKDLIPIGENYSGPYQGWRAIDAETPYQYLSRMLGDEIKIITADDGEISQKAKSCDVCLYFTKTLEGEGRDRCNLRLDSSNRTTDAKNNGGVIIDQVKIADNINQEKSILDMARSNHNSIVVLLNGSPIEMNEWIGTVPSILEAWYPGEQGSRAIYEILFGITNPSAKLPISFPKSIGQLPLCYSYKPSGRGYHYNENDGKPLFPFGYGLSYSRFKIYDFRHKVENNAVLVDLDIENEGPYDGAEVIQIYFGAKNCEVVRPLSELKKYRKIYLRDNQKKHVSLKIDPEAFKYYNQDLQYGLFDGDYVIKVGTSSVDFIHDFEVRVRNGIVYLKQ